MASEKTYKKTIKNELLGILFLAFGIFFAIALISYDPADPALNVTSNVQKISNLGGFVGAYTADILFSIFGISAYFLTAVMFLISFLQFTGREIRLNWKEAIAYAMLVISIAAIFHLRFEIFHLHSQPIEAGGLLGGLLGEIMRRWLGVAGAYIVCLTLAIASLLFATHLSVVKLAKQSKELAIIVGRWIAAFSTVKFEQSRKWLVKNLPLLKEWFLEKIEAWKNRKPEKKRDVKISNVAKAQQVKAPVKAAAKPVAENAPVEDEEESDDEEVDEEYEVEEESDSSEDSAKASTGPKIFERADSKPVKTPDAQLQLANISRDYTFPPTSLLDSPDQGRIEIDEEALKQNSLVLENKLKDYGVEGRVTEIHPGPIITMYEFEPAPGVKIGKIVNLEDDLAVTMGGRSVRIVPHLPGKAAIGIEIPNPERETVWLKDIINDPKFRRSSSKLTFALGKDIEDHPVVTDLAKMPHLLVAGATGSGKSVAINTMIVSLLYKTTPEEIRMILIDPKMLELPVYNGIPHLLLPVVTRPRKAVLALQWAVTEMERRYHVLADAGVRNIAGYNEKIEKKQLRVVSKDEADKIKETNPEIICHTGKLPYIVIIIDELADLMMVASKDIEENITRLAQLARAAGIHLILATQRPSVDVITGLIKANFPARIAFKVSGQHDSRTIIDTVGAEKLLGMGDMLFLPPNTSGILRLHGAFVTENEIARVVDHIKKQGKPVYDESIVAEKPASEGAAGGGDDEYDELYDSAVRLVSETKQASISMIQRKFRIGYNRAARLVEKMEAEGIVGPADGAKPREVLVSNLAQEGE